MRIITQIQQYGLKNSFSRALKLLLRFCNIYIESYILYWQKINIEKIESVNINSNYTIKKLDLNDYQNSTGLKFDDYKLNIFKKRFDNIGYEAYGVYDGATLIYSSWISIVDLEDSLKEYGLKLEAREGLLLDIITHPNYRKQGLHNYMNIFCLERIKEHGKDNAIVLVLKENIPAIKSQERSGFKKYKKIDFYKFFGFEKTIIRQL